MPANCAAPDAAILPTRSNSMAENKTKPTDANVDPRSWTPPSRIPRPLATNRDQSSYPRSPP